MRSEMPARNVSGPGPVAQGSHLTRSLSPRGREVTGYLWAAAGVAAVTWTLHNLITDVNHTTVALSYVVVVLLAASARGLGPGIFASVGGVICFNYFFLPPAGSFTIADPQNWVALTAFLITAVIASQLSSAARSRAADAERRREEVWKLYQLSRAVIIIPDAESAISSIAWQVLDIFGASFCSVLVPDASNYVSPTATTYPVLPSQVRSSGVQNSNVQSSNVQSSSFSLPKSESALPDSPAQSSPPSTPAKLPTTPGWTRLASASADGTLPPVEVSTDALSRVYNSGEAESSDLSSSGLTGKFLIYAPLKLGVRSVGVLVLLTSALEEGTVDAVAGSVAVALERARFLREASRNEALRQSDELKSALLATVSHALRTPLTSMRAAIDNLLEHDLASGSGPLTPDTLREFHLIISEEVGRLTRLVKNLLEMARIEAGELHLAKEWTLVSEVFANVLERCSPVLANHTATASVDDDMPLVKIDSRLIAEALVNIVENAAKYCPQGAEIKLEAHNEIGDLLIRVTDNGPGIAPQELDRVFDKFYRGPSVTEAGAAGTGMGLAIARGIIVAHGGRVWAESSKGHGTVITLAIPVESKPAVPDDSASRLAEFQNHHSPSSE